MNELVVPALPVTLAGSGAASAGAAAPARSPALGTLRGALTLLVVCHHALLAYHPFAPPVGPSLEAMPFWRAFPVVDPARWSGATFWVAWNDTFFMALMFLLSGLFAWPSLTRKGARSYLRDRLWRLGAPFAVYAAVLSPLAYVPSYLQTKAAWSFDGFWRQWWGLETWPTGPAWFLSLLLSFDLLAALVAWAARRRGGAHAPGPVVTALRRAPWALFAALLTAAMLTYVPLAERYGAMRWTTAGPLTFQTSRVLLYAGFFAVGLVVGARGLEGTVLATGGALARRAWGWAGLAGAAFLVHLVASARAMASLGQSAADLRLANVAYAAACAVTSVAVLAVALRLGARRPAPSAGAERGLAPALRRDAYAIYLVHYPIVSWLQYALLGLTLGGAGKAAVACAAAIGASWVVARAARRVAALARVL